jgi:hypothetical protein
MLQGSLGPRGFRKERESAGKGMPGTGGVTAPTTREKMRLVSKAQKAKITSQGDECWPIGRRHLQLHRKGLETPFFPNQMGGQTLSGRPERPKCLSWPSPPPTLSKISKHSYVARPFCSDTPSESHQTQTVLALIFATANVHYSSQTGVSSAHQFRCQHRGRSVAPVSFFKAYQVVIDTRFEGLSHSLFKGS